MVPLPNEIVVEIFFFYNHSYDPLLDYSDEPPPWKILPQSWYNCRWIHLMLVCRRWREIGLSTRSLWRASRIGRKVEWLRLVLTRSGNLPVDLRFDESAPILLYTPLLVSHIHRFRSVFLHDTQMPHALPLLQAIFNADTSLPLLSGIDVSTAPGGRLDLSPTRFPALRSLRLSSKNIHWTPAMFHQLRRLDLNECTYRDSALTMSQMMDVLAECAELEHLRLRLFLSKLRQRPTTTNDRTPITFPKMRVLDICETPAVISRFLSRVQLSADIDVVEITGRMAEATEDLSDAFMSLLPADRSGLPLLRSVRHGQIDCWIDSWALVGQAEQRSGPKMTIALEFARNPRDSIAFYLENAMREFATIFAGAPLTTLHVLGDHQYASRPGAWVRLFAAFPTIEYLEIVGSDKPLALVGALGQPLWEEDSDSDAGSETDSTDSADEPLVLPNLGAMSLEYLEWCPGLIEAMVTVFRRRVNRGMPKVDLGFRLETSDEDGFAGTMRECYEELESVTTGLDVDLYGSL
ncbi:hypothetical protein DICSQDRAFT_175269 [Dichomitus squalens LYAD-421 SS1]|uniref:F-box domain-containing protein n=1 Tax=Dichomitus squalens (strain LYAD-421) TaxID=732165 RepID=R7SJN1_DICSQ|nr:uncharacterized protein DICSQDRAFT_175269 [Dichomitus squalens LYAD-421 SS1]EJF56073.1 hypothetical protein DICSQDRAFT_175269 [Dichomitus squalens LYAD-421 SS1]